MSVANISRIGYAVTSIIIDVISLYWVLPYFHNEYVKMDYLVASLKNVQKGQLDLCLSFWDRKTSKAAAMY